MKRVVVLEDVIEWQGYIGAVLRDRAGATVEFVGTEESFRFSLAQFEIAPPDLFVLDCMLPWTTPKPSGTEAPSDVVNGTFHQAGIRCHRFIARSLKLSQTPVIFWTMISQGDLQKELGEGGRLPEGTYYVPKSELDALADLAISLAEGRR